MVNNGGKSGDIYEELLSPAALLFQAPNFNCHIIAIMGCKTSINPSVIKEGLRHTLIKHPRFSSKLVRGKKKKIFTRFSFLATFCFLQMLYIIYYYIIFICYLCLCWTWTYYFLNQKTKKVYFVGEMFFEISSRQNSDYIQAQLKDIINIYRGIFIILFNFNVI